MRPPAPAIDPAAAAAPARPPAQRWRTARRILHNPGAMIGASFLVLLVLVALLAPWLAPYNPDAQDLFHRLQPPSLQHLLGTDELGRDALSRLIYGTRISLVAAFGTVGIAAIIGCPLGLAAGYLGGRIDTILGRLSDGLMAVPALLLALAMIAVLSPGLGTAVLALGIIFIPYFFRMARAAADSIRQETFIEASVTIGSTQRRIILAHVVPNALAPLMVTAAVTAGTAVTAEASLSFLGVGVQPPTASWGSMLTAAMSNLHTSPWLVYPPGLMIALTVLAFSLLGDGIATALGTGRQAITEAGQ
ncbi:ABC transporter permease [Microbacterium sp. X-17]|uniref:ABC transporter permease n=1 Tax=Microbacterium sp. X-17 TaxID=3144404 RepID=UPI0031F4C305